MIGLSTSLFTSENPASGFPQKPLRKKQTLLYSTEKRMDLIKTIWMDYPKPFKNYTPIPYEAEANISQTNPNDTHINTTGFKVSG
jgi:hypothetical protein